jgi:hypothetical protein
MPRAQLVILDERTDGFYLFRFASRGRDAGDTWHQTVDDAKHQAEFEFDSGLGTWHLAPIGVELEKLALALLD